MKRRDILKGLALSPLLVQPIAGKSSRKYARRKRIIKPKRLLKGDTIGVIAPASGASQGEFDGALQNLHDFGFKTRVGKYARGEKGFLAGTDEERLHDLHWAFSDNEINAIWNIRGGYGASRLLPRINFNLIKKNPKIFIGYSDITALHIAIFRKTGLVTFHGPVGSSTFTEYTKAHVLNTLMHPRKPYKIELPQHAGDENTDAVKTEIITAGKCRGRLIGGNLSLLAAVTGTRFGLRKVKGRILFIEDVGEKPYRVDRMLTQLRQSIDMKSLAGIALGVFTGGKLDEDSTSQTLIEVLKDRLGDLGIPVIYGLSFGHIRDQFTLPLGVKAELDTKNATMTLLEAGVK